jgi:hypothetical protein
MGTSGQKHKKNFWKIFKNLRYLYVMSKKIVRLTESDLKNHIRKVISEQQLSNNRPHDKMVINCLLNAGFKVVNTNGKYDVYLKNSKGYYVFSDYNDPNKFYFEINDGSLGPTILNLTPGNDNCKTINNILDTQNGRGTNKPMNEQPNQHGMGANLPNKNWRAVVNYLKTTGYLGYKFKNFIEGNPGLGVELSAKSDQKPFGELKMVFTPDGKWSSYKAYDNPQFKGTYYGIQSGTWTWNQKENMGRGSLIANVTTNYKSKGEPINESQLIKENINNDIEDFRMGSRKVLMQLDYLSETIRKGDMRRANDEKAAVVHHIKKLEYVLETLKKRLM